MFSRVGIVRGWGLNPPVHVYRRSFLSENQLQISILGLNFKHFGSWPPVLLGQFQHCCWNEPQINNATDRTYRRVCVWGTWCSVVEPRAAAAAAADVVSSSSSDSIELTIRHALSLYVRSRSVVLNGVWYRTSVETLWYSNWPLHSEFGLFL